MNIRLRTKKIIGAGLIGAGIMLVIATISGYFFYTKTQERELALKKEYRDQIDIMSETVKQNEKGYALTEDVKQGARITKDILKEVTLPAAAKSTDGIELLEVDVVDYFARADLQENTVLVGSMVYEENPITSDIRETEYAFIDLPTKLTNDDYVDVRIQFPNGDDYVLLSKKKVKDVAGLTVWMDLGEGELLTMSSGIVDAFVEEAKIYALPYVDGPMQADAQITYPVKKNVLQLIKESPNMVNIAKLNLEKQNRERLEAELEKMDSEQRHKLRSGEAKNESEKKQDEKERELNAANQFDKEPTQEDIVGGTTNEGDDEK